MEGLLLPWIPRLQGFKDHLEVRLSFDFSLSILLLMGYWGNSSCSAAFDNAAVLYYKTLPEAQRTQKLTP